MYSRPEKENVRKLSFFGQFQEFSLQLQNEISDIKKAFEAKPGSHPMQYDQGLGALKSEIYNIKELVEGTKEKVLQVQRFSHFVESTKDLISAQKDDVLGIENYLKRYGYKPPVTNENLEQCLDTLQSDTNEDEKEDRIVAKEIVSPELSEVGKSVLQGKNIPVKDNVAVALKHLTVNAEIVAVTPVQKKKSTWCTPTPIASSRKRLEEWIASVEAANAYETPILKKDLPRICFNESPPSSLNVQRTAMRITREGKKSMPDEPVMSFVTTELMQEEPSVTPEEPTLSEIGFTIGRKFNKVEDTTPVEPILQSQIAPKEELGQSYGSRYTTPPTPKSPQLSDITQKILNVKQLQFPEELKEVEHLNKKYKEKSLFKNDEPESPQLSDVTLKILGRNF